MQYTRSAEIAFGGVIKKSPRRWIPKIIIERLLQVVAPAEEENDEDEDEAGGHMKLTSFNSIIYFTNCAGDSSR